MDLTFILYMIYMMHVKDIRYIRNKLCRKRTVNIMYTLYATCMLYMFYYAFKFATFYCNCNGKTAKRMHHANANAKRLCMRSRPRKERWQCQAP